MDRDDENTEHAVEVGVIQKLWLDTTDIRALSRSICAGERRLRHKVPIVDVNLHKL